MPLAQLSNRPVAIGPCEHVVVSVLRNESLRIASYLDYYRRLGFDAFLIVDNGSTDGTRDFLLAQPDVHLFSIADSFRASGFGMQWVNALLSHFCQDRWILLADADELLLWPGGERETIQQLTARLDAVHARALVTLLLDMYSDRPFGQVGYVPGTPFIDCCPYFDRGPYSIVEAAVFPFRQIHGGVRARVFHDLPEITFHPPTVSKLPLVRWQPGQQFANVAHALADPVLLAPMRGVLLHFKMFDDLPEKCAVEVARREHFAGAREYRAMAKAIERAPNHSFFDQRASVRFIDTRQLLSLGLMNSELPFAPFSIGEDAGRA